MTLVVFDDAVARSFEPFALTRPISELRAGAELLRRRWEIAFGDTATGIAAAEHLAGFEESGTPPVVRERVERGTILANSRCAVGLTAVPPDADAWTVDGRVGAVRVAERCDVATIEGLRSLDQLLARDATIVEVAGWWIDDLWDLIRHLREMLIEDARSIGATIDCQSLAGRTALGEHPVFLEQGATVDPFVVFEAVAGPVLVRHGAHLAPFTRIVGPCVVGPDVIVHGGKISGSSIGESSRVHGEVSATIFTGQSNKAHDGFIGHSVIGRWVNLGASTVGSNLKNTYGSVSLWTPGGIRDTGLQFLGAFLGDHVKTAIGTRLTTGCVVGAGANVFGDEVVPKVVPPFAWGIPGDEAWALDRFLIAAERAMSRRGVALGDGGRQVLTNAHRARWRAPG